MSPPSRGAWIEICRQLRRRQSRGRRPPRGGRGLKLNIDDPKKIFDMVAPLAGGVD